jgi:hypothetical protein
VKFCFLFVPFSLFTGIAATTHWSINLMINYLIIN